MMFDKNENQGFITFKTLNNDPVTLHESFVIVLWRYFVCKIYLRHFGQLEPN